MSKEKASPRIEIVLNDVTYKLTKKQEFFCRNYVANGHNGKYAALAAGYSKGGAKNIASENLAKLYLSEYIRQLEKPTLEKLNIDEAWVVSKLHTFATANILDFFDVRREVLKYKDEDGNERTRTKLIHDIKDFNLIPPEKLACIESLEELKDGTYKIKLSGQRAATVDVGKTMGVFTEKIEGKVDVSHSRKVRVYVFPKFEDEDD